MADHAPGIENADPGSIVRGYEARDIRIRPLLWLFAGFVVLFTLLCCGLWWFHRLEMRRAISSDEARSVVTPATRPGDGPPLQPQVGHESLDASDLQAMRERENATLRTLGWRQERRTGQFAVPGDIVEKLQQRQVASRPAGGAR